MKQLFQYGLIGMTLGVSINGFANGDLTEEYYTGSKYVAQ